MYNVPARFHTLAIADSPKTRCRIYFITDAVNCWDDNDVQTNGTLLVGAVGDTDSNGRIGQGGVTVTEIFNKDKNLTLGGTVSYQIGMTLVNSDGALNNFAFGRCKVYLDVYDDANSTWLPCPLGVFRIELPVKRKVQLISCTGYDQMQVLNAIADTWWNGLDFTGGLTIANILNSMVTQLGLRLSATSSTNMVNTTLSFTTPPIDSVERTYRDILGWIAEATGTVAHFNRDGELDMRQYLTPQIGGNNIVIDTDTTGNQCLSIDVAEYSVSQIDALTIKLTTADQGVTVGSGTNVYTIMDNPFLYGPDVATIQSKLTPIYNRLSAYATYSPISTRLIYDWSIEAGDIIYILNNSATYNMPIFQQKMTWRGGYVTSELISSGDTVRQQVSSSERETYRYNVEMATKVGDNEIISKINQTAESIQIQASRVDLAGYVTFTNLSTSGQTTIDGGNITTGTIDASVVTVDNINASNISSGTLSADRIAAGSLAIGKLDSAAQNTINGANSQEQLIYRSKVSGTTSLSKTTTWVTNTTGNQDTWTLKRPTYNSSYPVLFIATQRKDVGGTVTCTTPQIDNTTTVIDGGNIITGTVTANKLNAADINASKILTVGSMTDAAAATVLNSNIAIGGRNIATGTATVEILTTAANQNYFIPAPYPLSAYSATALSDASNTQVTVSFDYSITGVDTAFSLTVGFFGGQSYTEIVTAKAGIPIGSSAGHAEATKDITNNMRQYAYNRGVLFAGSGNANANAVLTVSNLKIEIGNKATTWTQAPEDVAADIATAQTTADSANSQEQLIYISKVSGTTTQSGTTTWVTNTTGNQNTWTIKRPVYNSSYPVLFVATQRKSVGGTVTCTTPQIDQTTTVIDGGHITTGTIDAGVVNVTNINASNITSGELSANRISGGTLTVGGVNDQNGQITILNNSGDKIGSINNAGYFLYNPGTNATAVQIGRYGNGGSYINVFDDVRLGGVFLDATNTGGGDIWVAGKNGAVIFSVNGNTGITTANNTTINGVLDVTPRRCYATLSSAGWYRVLTISGEGLAGRAGRAWTIDLNITRTHNGADNEVHSIKLLGVLDSFSFANEVSKSNVIGIDKIRYMRNGDVGYVDIHYSLTSSNGVSVDFDVHTRYDAQSAFTANSLAGVGPSPSGETEEALYTFAANTISPFIRQISYSGRTDANGNLEIPLTVANYASKHYVLQYASTYATALAIAGNLLYVKCFKYNGTAQANANVTVYLLEN